MKHRIFLMAELKSPEARETFYKPGIAGNSFKGFRIKHPGNGSLAEGFRGYFASNISEFEVITLEGLFIITAEVDHKNLVQKQYFFLFVKYVERLCTSFSDVDLNFCLEVFEV